MEQPPDHRSKRTMIRYVIVAAKLIAAIGTLIAAITTVMDEIHWVNGWVSC